MAISNPHSNPQSMMFCTTSAYVGSPRRLLSCCKTYPGSIDTVEVSGSSPDGPTIILNNLESFLWNPAKTSPVIGPKNANTVVSVVLVDTASIARHFLHYRLTAMPNISKCAPPNNGPDPKNALAGSSVEK
jgi:hypothetical protein